MNFIAIECRVKPSANYPGPGPARKTNKRSLAFRRFFSNLFDQQRLVRSGPRRSRTFLQIALKIMHDYRSPVIGMPKNHGFVQKSGK
jgi:hypothetical protein